MPAHALADDDGNIDWEQTWLIERDICYLYHLLVPMPGVDGDQSFGFLFSLAYWDVFCSALPDMSADSSRFIKRGCLMMILTMCWDILDGSGTYLEPYCEQCRSIISAIKPVDDTEEKIVTTVISALDRVLRKMPADDEIREATMWCKHETVWRYFNETSSKFYGDFLTAWKTEQALVQ